MPNGPGTYDGAMQQWRESSALVVERLCFERFIAFRGRGEHRPFGPPTGEYATESALEIYANGSQTRA